MKRSLFVPIVSLLVGAMLLTGCNVLVTTRDTGSMATKEYDIDNFSAVDVGSAFEVEISRSDNYSVRITSNENPGRIRVVKVGDTLRIGHEGTNISIGSRTLRARITMPELTGLELSGSSRATVRGFKSTSDLDTRISGASSLDIEAETGVFVCRTSGNSKVDARIKSASADIEQSGASTMVLDMETGSFTYGSSGSSDARGTLRATGTDIHLTGASRVKLTGSGGDLRLTGSGSSTATLAGFTTQDADVNLSGASDADMDVEGKLSVSLSGGSDLKYGGNPTFGDRMDVTGGSRIGHR